MRRVRVLPPPSWCPMVPCSSNVRALVGALSVMSLSEASSPDPSRPEASPSCATLPAALCRLAGDQGFALIGVVDAARFDAGQPRESRVTAVRPRCGTVLVLATAGAHWRRALDGRGGRSERHFARAIGAVRDWIVAHAADCSVIAPTSSRVRFECLGEAAGFGTISPVTGLLLHPTYGPWLRVRAAVLVDGHPFGAVPDASIAERFQPCLRCPQPCVEACPCGVHDGHGSSDLVRCAGHRHGGGCATGCASRRACPIGSEHAEADVVADAHAHGVGLAALRREQGFGWWRLVPARWRNSVFR
jgi:hypothetical protein